MYPHLLKHKINKLFIFKIKTYLSFVTYLFSIDYLYSMDEGRNRISEFVCLCVGGGGGGGSP